ncbi:MAG TPA: GTPase [Candidatus Limnocylindrales bacterium]|nr:GTPase [Candidatus Limnocylindrales bacterium]
MTLEERIERLAGASEAVRGLGLGEVAGPADAVVRRARERIGFSGEVYVLALAGGTGVGKSSVLNALAGRTVSAVRAVRPTTDEPIAWVADARREELAPLLDWIGVRHVAGHADPSLAGVAILDLPDVDSIRTEHRARVDELLPRIDALAWVVDPEKYDDDRLHAYLRSLREHAARMRLVLNKIDRVAPADREPLESDLRRRLDESGIGAAAVSVVSAQTGEGIGELRAALAAGADAKSLVLDKLAADARAATLALAHALDVEGAEPAALVDPRRVEEATRGAVDGALAVVDPPGLARQIQAGVLGRARRRGGSLLSRVVALLAWLTGQQRRRADPAGYLRDWRRRGSLGRILNPIRTVQLEAAARMPPSSRRAVLATMGADDLESAMTRVLDGVAREAAEELHVPASWLWHVIGVVQLAIGAVFAFAAAWYITLFVATGVVPVSTVDVPVLGPLPVPLVLLVGSIVASAILGWLLSLHAGWLGARRGRRVAERVRQAVSEAVESAGLRGLRQVEEVRAEVGRALSAQ